ncbi:MAG: type II CAAX endopeptidase family protein [Patescibacteria group bacterium]
MKKYFQAPWGFKDLIITGTSIAVLFLIAGYILHLLGTYDKIEASKYKFLYTAVLFLVQWIIAILPLIVLTKIKYGFEFGLFGFKKVGIWKVLKLVALAYLIYIGISFIVSTITIFSDVKIPGYQMQESILPFFGSSDVALISAGLVVVFVAPFLEEIFFRGFLLRTFVDKIGIFFGSIVSAGIFAIIHFQWASIIPIFILGLIINMLVIKSKSIVPAIAFHILNNGIVFAIQVLIEKEIISM